MHKIHLSAFGRIGISHNGVFLEALPLPSVHLFALLTLLGGTPCSVGEVASRLFPCVAEKDALSLLQSAQESLWKGFPLSIRLFQGISVADAEKFDCGMRLVSAAESICLSSDVSHLESLLTADWEALDRNEAVRRLTESTEVLDRGFLPGVSSQWGLETGERLGRMYRAAALALLPAVEESAERAVVPSFPAVSAPFPPFFGRQEELETLLSYLVGGEKTLTLVGLGGVGKSRLALEFVRTLPEPWRQVPLLRISLGNVVTRVSVLEAILEALGKRVGGAFLQGRDTLVTVVQALQEATILFLDNVEDAAIEPGGDVVQLLSYLRYRCPELIILSTSRCRVGIPEELIVSVSAFDLPSVDDLSRLAPPEICARFPGLEMISYALEGSCKEGLSVRADVERQREFLELTGGLPLAIEMLAARAAVAGRLPAVEEVSGGALSPARSIEWALSTVSSEASDLFFAVSLFCDSFSVEAAEGITGKSGVGYSLSELDDVALLQAVPGDGFLRYRMVPAVRSWAREQLRSQGAFLEMQEAHARYFGALLEPGVVHAPEKIAPLAMWLSDMAAAVEFYMQGGLLARASTVADTLGQLFRITGRFDAGIDLMRRLLAALDAAGNAPTHCLAEVRDCLGRLLVNAKGNSEAVEHLEFALDYWTDTNNTANMSRACNNLGILADRSKDIEYAIHYYSLALEGFTALGNNEVAICSLTFNLGGLEKDRGDLVAARVLLEKSLRIAGDVLGDAFLTRNRLLNLGEICYLQGDISESLTYLRKSILQSVDRDLYYFISHLSIILGLIGLKRDREDHQAKQLLLSGAEFFHQQGIAIPTSILIEAEVRVIQSDRQVEIPDLKFESLFLVCQELLGL